MANEVNTLNIGGTSYPIYSEGIKVDSSTSGTFFLVAGGAGNRKIGISSAITGDNETLAINSSTLNIGDTSNTIWLGNNATNVFVGEGASNVYIGYDVDYVAIGEDVESVYVGYLAEDVILGANSGSVSVGSSATGVSVGSSATGVWLGNDATNVILGQKSENVYLGETASNVYLGQYADSVYIGESAQTVRIGDSASNVYLGDSASNVYLGTDAYQISIGPNITGDVNRNTIRINDDGELYMTGTHRDIEDSNKESHISMEYDSGTGSMSLNLASGSEGEINIGANSGTDKVLIKTNYGILSGKAELNIDSGSIMRMFSPFMEIESPNLYITNSTTAAAQKSQFMLNETGITMSANDFNFTVTPNASLSNGFSIVHPNNSNIGITFNVPSVSAPVLFMAPRAAYSSSAAVHLGNTTRRFGSLYVTNGYATSGFSTSSDERLKDFGENIEVDLDALAALRKSYYRWNETSGFENEKDRMIGMSAQEVQKLYPEVVTPDENGVLSMSYDRLSVVALAAIDKLHNENKELKSENAELKDRLTRLENLVNEKLSAL